MHSSHGRASETPVPCRKVRRFRCQDLVVMNCVADEGEVGVNGVNMVAGTLGVPSAVPEKHWGSLSGHTACADHLAHVHAIRGKVC